MTRYDEVVLPYTSGFLSPARSTTNIPLQDKCPADVADHLYIPMDQQAIAWTLEAFHHDGPATRPRRSAAPAEAARVPRPGDIAGIPAPARP